MPCALPKQVVFVVDERFEARTVFVHALREIVRANWRQIRKEALSSKCNKRNKGRGSYCIFRVCEKEKRE